MNSAVKGPILGIGIKRYSKTLFRPVLNVNVYFWPLKFFTKTAKNPYYVHTCSLRVATFSSRILFSFLASSKRLWACCESSCCWALVLGVWLDTARPPPKGTGEGEGTAPDPGDAIWWYSEVWSLLTAYYRYLFPKDSSITQNRYEYFEGR